MMTGKDSPLLAWHLRTCHPEHDDARAICGDQHEHAARGQIQMACGERHMIVTSRIHVNLTQFLQEHSLADRLASREAQILQTTTAVGPAGTLCDSREKSRRKLVLRKDTTSVA
jgi:hypothetical protein